MHGQGERAAQLSNTLDTGLACLVMLGRLRSVTASTEQKVAQGYLFGKAETLLASPQLQLRAEFVRSKLDRFPQTSLPAIACAEDGRHFIISQIDQDKILTQDPRAQRPQALNADELQARWSGELILTRSKTFWPGDVSRFELTWFISAVGAQINVVAKVSGKIVASGESETMQPSEVAVVKSIRAQDGQQVKASDVLVELDTIATGADIKRLKSNLLAAEVDSARATALIESIRTGREPGSLTGHVPQAAPEQEQVTQRRLQGQYQELLSSLEQVDAEVEQVDAEIQSTRVTLASPQKTLPIVRRLAEVSASKKEAERRRQVLLAQTRRTMLDLQQQSEQKAASLVQELNKAEQCDQLMSLTAPVDGTVQKLAMHTVGGVVTAAQPRMMRLRMKSAGRFISPGFDCINDAVAAHGQNVSLSPGMSVTAEVKTDRRRAIEYFFSLLQQCASEGLKMR
ncbi:MULTISPECIES: cysteine peptidase family C39 domain-containing protein [Pseudomonas]|uniref:cysteine peptidase family C39 domain-containing protein n=1 Tax=Pseudomonas TaxID=286 RepID=UPI000DF91EDD|nr:MULTISPECIES: cysteine peptidase family C39 domain-containing protein [Pseudomonas]RBH52709.1 hypothetical protein C3F00_030930 [Pseudomonas sp. MWU13-2860]